MQVENESITSLIWFLLWTQPFGNFLSLYLFCNFALIIVFSSHISRHWYPRLNNFVDMFKNVYSGYSKYSIYSFNLIFMAIWIFKNNFEEKRVSNINKSFNLFACSKCFYKSSSFLRPVYNTCCTFSNVFYFLSKCPVELLNSLRAVLWQYTNEIANYSTLSIVQRWF